MSAEADLYYVLARATRRVPLDDPSARPTPVLLTAPSPSPSRMLAAARLAWRHAKLPARSPANSNPR